MGTGNPIISFPVPRDVYEELKRRAGDPPSGGAGGMSLLMRKIVYEYLRWEMPPQWGELGRSSKKRERTGRKGGWPKGRPRGPRAKASESPEAADQREEVADDGAGE